MWMTRMEGLVLSAPGSKANSTPRSGYTWPRISPISLETNTGFTEAMSNCWAILSAGNGLSKRITMDDTFSL